MLPTFVIGLREGVEAALIVGIVAAFLRQRGRRDALRWMWAGVALAIALCTGAAVALRVAQENLPQRQQEQLETVVGIIAVGMITWMILWMRKHSRGLRAELEGRAAHALTEGSGFALAGMAFLAVVREGLETAVFLLAAFDASDRPSATGTGAVLGIAVAIALGYGIYRGGVHIDLGRFFRFTGVVLVLVAAGLTATAAHTANEAGWLTVLQGRALDLRWLIEPGSVISALVTGMFGIQPEPTFAETVVWVGFAVPMLLLVVGHKRTRKLGSSAANAGAADRQRVPDGPNIQPSRVR
jgi:high-affinity iron transporter